MKPANSELGRSFVAVLLFLASVWLLNISASNWWVASFHERYWQDYASRGNMFFVLSLFLLGGFIFVVASIFRMKSRN